MSLCHSVSVENKVEQASHDLSAVAELLDLDISYLLKWLLVLFLLLLRVWRVRK